MGERPLVALVHNVQTPYRIHFHRRLAREALEIRIASLFTHDQADQPWERSLAEEINPVQFGAGHPVALQSRPGWAFFDWRKGGRIIRWLRDQRAAAVVIGGYNDLTRLRVIAWCRRAGVPCFVFSDSNIHGDHTSGVKRTLKNVLVRWVVRSCAGVLPCGTLGARYFARYGARADRTFFVPYEPDYEAITRLEPSFIADVASRFALDPTRRRFVVCARLVDFKRVDVAIDAFVSVAHQRPEWELIIVGDGPLRSSLESRVPAALRDRVRFLGFVGSQSLISAIYRSSHVLVCSSDTEPWGVVIGEAAAAGLAIVSTGAAGAAAELVREHVNGRTFPPGDVGALADALLDVSDSQNLEPMRAASATVLAEWRQRGDPVDGLRRALRGSLGRSLQGAAHT